MHSKTNWDYFCELMIAIPGLNSMFTDAPGSDSAMSKSRMYKDDTVIEWKTGASGRHEPRPRP